MPLKEEFIRSGGWLFKRRSYLPLLLAAVFAAGILRGGPAGAGPAGAARLVAGLAVAALGLAVRIFTIGYSPAGTAGRNTEGQVAEVLNSTGIYSAVRHPLYLGNFLMWLGVSLYGGIWWIVLVTVLAFVVYYERIMFAEEEFLRARFGEDFEEWARKTPAFIPSFRKWEKPRLPFSARSVLQKEYSGFFSMVCSFTFVDILLNAAAGSGPAPGPFWKAGFAAGLAVYVVLRTLKRKTPLLSVEGR
ncbi:MAG: isoprenylcysteine carboxylmethyltransferase family protein [Candidatus Krumholzibacteria bacterium]|nr:isoprenylcysteine carboxylmethyltransferase family protein [Candidatus Krumholzibacteria bacterium]